jgi:hypothetical protein
MIRNYSGHVTAKIVGVAASISSYIPMMADHIEVEDNAIFMIHNPFTIVMGDHRRMSAVSEVLESMAALLAKAYAAQTGKTLEEIFQLMDDETFLFGEEIVQEGFADEVIDRSDKEKSETPANTKSGYIMAAQGDIKACRDLVDEAAKGKTIDVKKIAALMGAVKPKNTEPKPKTTGKPPVKAEQKTMTWQEFLKENPEAEAEYEKKTQASYDQGREEGEKAGREAINATMDTALPILSSTDYPDTVKAKIGEKMKAGDVDGIKEIVSTLDMIVEAQKSNQAEGEQAGETLADDPKANDGLITDLSQLGEAVAIHKQTFGTGV